jgi:FkbM family methyltransferase
MSYIVKLILLILDKYVHQKKIFNFFKNSNYKLNNIIDIGSHKGDYIKLFIKINNKANILAFEPQEKIFRRSIQKFKNYKNVKIFNLGAGDKNEVKFLKNNLGSDYISTFSRLRKKSKYFILRNFLLNFERLFYNNHQYERVKIIKLDKFNYLKNKIWDLIKIDVEGFELRVLKGLKKTLKKTKCIIIEFHFDNLYNNYSCDSLHKYLTKNKFILKKKIKFPLLKWEDRIYVKL